MHNTFRGAGLLVAFTLVLLFASAPARAQVPPDAIDLSQATVYNSPSDIASWPVTAAITQLTMAAPDFGLSFEFTKKDSWPDYTPPGWAGSLEYTVWAVVNVNGHWYTSGFIQMWRGRASTGAPLLTIPPGSSVNNFAKNWAYDSRWGAMSYSVSGYQPHAGETVGFFVSAGNARGVGSVTSVRERSNVVTVALPANDTGVFAFAATAPLTAPPPAPTIALPPPSSMLAGDFNGDGQPDILAQSAAGLVTLAMNNGTSFNQLQSPYNGVTSLWRIVGVRDFNGDGRPDLVWQGPTGRVVVWFNNGSAAPTVLDLYTGASVWRVVGVADIDRDGNSDLIWQSPTGQVVVWFMQGLTLLHSDYLWGEASVWRVTGAGDFNGDGDADLLWQAPSGALVVWTLHGMTLASAPTVYGAATPWKVLSVGDLNGDGMPDILWEGPTGQDVVWMMNGLAASDVKYVNKLSTGWQISATP